MTRPNNLELYVRSTDTLVASWTAYARGAAGADVRRSPGVAAAVFPHDPERSVYNNALLDRYLGPEARAAAIDALEAAYATAGVARFAVWAHETDLALVVDLEARGYTFDSATRVMIMSLADLGLPRPEIPLDRPTWPEYLRAEGLSPSFLADADHAQFHALAARIDGEIVASSLAYDHGTDCGIYNVSTLERFRRRGFGTALTVAQLHDARDRGRRTASLQASAMAEGVYVAAGFHDFGRILEYVPAASTASLENDATH
jgi:ribosomal protein S18 acetylase RimI-like enzyme